MLLNITVFGIWDSQNFVGHCITDDFLVSTQNLVDISTIASTIILSICVICLEVKLPT